MPAYKDKQRKTWYAKFYVTDQAGNKKQKLKRGFATKREALDYERSYVYTSQTDITFGTLYEAYIQDASNRLKHSTLQSKQHIFKNHILPYFQDRKINEITPADIRNWQNMHLEKHYKNTYLSAINTQLSSIMHYAERFYNLSSNPCTRAGAMGSATAPEMSYWTHEEFQQFIAIFNEKPKVRLAFLMLYWTGVREGELLALTFADINFTSKEIQVTKTYHRFKGADYITTPKTPTSIRKIPIPDFLCEDIKKYMESVSPSDLSERIFKHTKDFLEYHLKYGCKHSGVKHIRVHDIRHSHASLLISLGFTPVLIAKRMGHNKVSTTLNIYSHMFPHQQDELVAALESLNTGFSNT